MNDQDSYNIPPEAATQEGATTKPEKSMTSDEAIELLKAGKPIGNVRIDRLKFEGEFPNPVALRNVVLIRPTFNKAIFRGEVSFVGCVLDRPIAERGAEFDQGLTLSNSTLIKCVLQNLKVRGPFKANDVKVKGKFTISKSTYEKPANFWEATFHCWVEFRDCEFRDVFDFRSAHVHEGFVFNKSRFAGDVLLRGSAFTKKWEIRQSKFEGLLDFSKAKFNDYAYLEGMEQGDKQRFAFNNTIGERVLIRPEQLEGRLASEQAGQYEQAAHEYAYLKRTYSALHRYEDEDWAFYRFKVNQRRAKPRSWLRPWSKIGQFSDWLLLDLGCGYCTNPSRAVRTAFIILIGFAMIYAAGIDKFHLDKVPFDGWEKTDWPNRIVFSLVTSVAVFTSGLSGIKDIAKDWMNIPLVVEALLGTLLWGLFIVAFSRKVIR